MHQLRKRLTYANVMSSLAVFFVLGGATAFAATKIGTNEIKASAITTGKIAKEAVAQGKIKAGAVGNSRLGNGSVSAQKIAPNAVTSAALANGAVTAATLGSVTRMVGESTPTNVVGTTKQATVNCPAGSVAISGGAAWETESGNASTLAGLIRVDRPIPGGAGAGLPTGWEATGEQTAAFNRVLRVYAICLA